MFPDNKQGIRIIEGSKTSSIKHFTIKIYTAFKKEKFISLQLKKNAVFGHIQNQKFSSNTKIQM